MNSATLGDNLYLNEYSGLVILISDFLNNLSSVDNVFNSNFSFFILAVSFTDVV